MNHHWPVELVDGDVVLRPIRQRDHRAWREVNHRNREWLRPWEATVPPPPPGHLAPRRPTFRQMVRHLRSEAHAGRMFPFVVEYRGRLVGQLTVAGVAWGSMCSAHIGYWIDREVAGRGVMPTAVALVTDFCFRAVGLHRLEICIRPENGPSRRVVEKLGYREEGLRPRYLHIDGDWRDHLIFALTSEEAPESLLEEWRERPAGRRVPESGAPAAGDAGREDARAVGRTVPPPAEEAGKPGFGFPAPQK
ncbi:GNAT family N-acetyltransferase [Streptomyces alkaliphilus]|uniref:GNAT family N-acetyltransferase n=1 Tax=Streptomyces alkaliphilus TaxID=1472722 RepID=UPI001180725D|nr:GNAT family protein [Streptomyces alkaliphilus]MQS09842.1 GNAT family N-acetyltransferase [Streptomyces alkaliphilus]